MKPVPIIDPNIPPTNPKNRVLKFFPSVVGDLVDVESFSTTFKRSVAGLRLVCWCLTSASKSGIEFV